MKSVGTGLRNMAVLVFGLLISLVALSKLQQPVTPAQDREELQASLIFVGLPLTALGGWLMQAERRQAQRHDLLQESFFRVLKRNQGYISVIQFAIATGLEGRLAKAYLDERALEFNADYEVSETGSITYYFELETVSRVASIL